MSLPRRICSIALVAALLLCAAPLCPSASAFSDTQGSWAAQAAEKAAAYGLMNGYPDGSFGIGKTITRAEFAAILCRIFNWPLTPPETPSYIDCAPQRWYYAYVEAACANGAADRGGPFRPEDGISREEMAVMLVRALGYDAVAQALEGAELPFADVNSNSGYIAVAYDTGMITGTVGADGALSFRPTATATREEAAAMLVRFYERYTAPVDWLHGFYAFSSYSQINLTPAMDAVSVGWARLEFDPAQGARLNSTSENGNDWVRPADPTPATEYFERHNTPYHLNIYASAGDTVVLEDGGRVSVLSAILSAPQVRAQAVGLLCAAAEGYAGLTLDFEGLQGGLREDYTAFAAALRAALPTGKRLFICVQPEDWYQGFDYRGLGESCDKLILMAHDYQWTAAETAKHVGTANTDSPVTPFFQVYRALRAVTDPDTGVADRSKLALAISFNTAGFRVDENGVLLEGAVYHPARDVLTQRLQQADTVVSYSQRYRNPAAVYTTGDGGRYRVWYEDSRSVLDKLQLCRMFGITGVSLWRLGTIPASTGYDVWSAIQAVRP